MPQLLAAEGKAKPKKDVSLIFVFLHGGQSHIDTFDLPDTLLIGGERPDADEDLPASTGDRLLAEPATPDKFGLAVATGTTTRPRPRRPLHPHWLLPDGWLQPGRSRRTTRSRAWVRSCRRSLGRRGRARVCRAPEGSPPAAAPRISSRRTPRS
ncbi:MAG: hypothetical protein U0792_14065 [Gemmataceae bacterium]